MITIQMAGGMLDVKSDQDISFEWTAFRFADGLREQFTNDLELPKTHNNISILGCYNLLDSPNQLYGSQIQPAILTVDGRMIDCYLQVVSVNKNTITICLYEMSFPMDLRNKNIARMFTDDSSTIIAWNTNTMTAYPNWFKVYDYGMPYDSLYAQYHPIMKLDDILPTVAQECNITIPSISPDWYVMATGKCVCPQNQTQYVEGRLKDDNSFCIMGGQHITNDLEYSSSLTDNNTIVFNRDCTVTMSIWISWESKANGYNIPFLVNQWHSETQTNTTFQFNMDGQNYTNDITTGSATFTVKANDKLSFDMSSGNYFNLVSMVAKLEITGYDISDDDYSTELHYVSRLPRLVVYQYASGTYEYWYFDTTTYNLSYHRKGTSSTLHRLLGTPWASFAWFGYWANVPEMSAADLIWGIAWLLGRKPVIENGTLTYEDADTAVQIDGVITETRMSSDKFGMKNYIRWNGDENAEPYLEINNVWLENEKNLHESPFGKMTNISQYSGKVQQYSNPEHDEDSGEYSCDFEDVGFIIAQNITHIGNMQVISPSVRDIPLQNMGLGAITSIVEVDIETFDTLVEPADYIYLDGRKYMVVSGDIDVKNKQCTITALLVPTL